MGTLTEYGYMAKNKDLTSFPIPCELLQCLTHSSQQFTNGLEDAF